MITTINEKEYIILPQNTFISVIGSAYNNKDGLTCYPPYITVIKKECTIEFEALLKKSAWNDATDPNHPGVIYDICISNYF